MTQFWFSSDPAVTELQEMCATIDKSLEVMNAGILDLFQHVVNLKDGQSRFMSDIFTQVNDANDRLRVLETRITQLELIVRGLYDTRSAGAHASYSATISIARNDRSGEDGFGERSRVDGERSARESNSSGGSETPR